jgi:hypothetical protein
MRVLLRVLLAAIVVPGLLACGAYRFPGDSTPSFGTVTGQVLSTPCSPVVRPGYPCPGRPVPNTIIAFASGSNRATTATDSNGHYTVELATGSWDVTLKTFGRLISGPRTVTVSANATTVANYLVDSGIREPVPVPQPAPGD